MAKFVQFFSLTILTQAVLALNQIVLLPIQIRIWGHASTAHWYTTLAIAAIVTVADFGLRTAGHAELIRYARNRSDEQAKTEFRHLWAWIRLLLCMVTIPLALLDMVYGGYRLWHTALIVGVALETLLCVRVMYLDSLQLYREAEAGYLLLAIARLFLSIGAMVIFHSSPRILGWIWLLTGIFAIAQQERLCSRIGLLRLFEPMPPGLSFRTLVIARHTMADPASTWMRLSVPVLVLSVIAQPVAVTTYVALRAVFGAARQTAMQVSRYASIQYVHYPVETQIILCVLSVGFIVSLLSYAVLADNFRLVAFWLRSNTHVYGIIAPAFALGAPLYAYQVMQALMLRHGKINAIARYQYLYIGCLVIFAVIALLTKWPSLWLSLILMGELLISISFMLKPHIPALTSISVRTSLALLSSAVFAAALSLLIHCVHPDFLQQSSATAIAWTLALLSLWILVTAAVYLYIAHDLLPEARALVSSTLDAFFRARSQQRRLQND